jgi:hypothetical protein
MHLKTATAALLAAALLAISACDKATPVAPTGTILSVAANPSRIGLNGTSTVTVFGRKPDGNPLNRGTEIRLSTSLGTIPSLVTVDDNGAATAILRGDGRAGDATITATTGDGTVSTTAVVQIGESSTTKPILLVSVSPNNIPVQSTATVTVIARNSDGSPVGAGQTVILTSTLGSLSPSRPTTRADGTATSTFSAGIQPGSATITAILGSSDAAITTVTIRDSATSINVQANPSVVPSSGGSVTITAFVVNSQGLGVQGAQVNFQSDNGTLSSTSAFTNTSGIATVTLTLTQENLVGESSVVVTATTPRGDGGTISDSVTITVQ